MQFGFNLPNSGALAQPEMMARVAREGEALGYDYLTVTDHVTLPDMAEPGYPYSESGAFYSTDSAYRHEMLTLAAWLASVTQRLRLVLAVLVVPHRPAVLAAKQLATIDVLSGGRLTVGIGAGWLKAEFDAVVTTPFAERGAVTDEYVAAFKTLWTEKKPVIDGKYVHYDRLLLEPKPTQKPHPPIWVGGFESGPSLRRARRRLGDALVPDRHQQRGALRQPAALPGRGRAPAPADRSGWPQARRGRADLSHQALRQGRARPCWRRRASSFFRQRRRSHRRHPRPWRPRRHRPRFRLRAPHRRCGPHRHARLPREGAGESLECCPDGHQIAGAPSPSGVGGILRSNEADKKYRLPPATSRLRAA